MTAALALPALGRITNGFRTQPDDGKPSHLALDFGWGNGYEVYAAETGTISYDESIGYGKRLSIVHKKTIGGKQTITRYAHLNAALVKSGTVQRGQMIGRMGKTGTFAEFDHLHFELLLDGKKSNPINYFTDTAGGGTTPIGDDMPLSADEIALLNRAVAAAESSRAALWYGGVSGGVTYKYGVLPILVETQRVVVEQAAEIAALKAALANAGGGSVDLTGIAKTSDVEAAATAIIAATPKTFRAG